MKFLSLRHDIKNMFGLRIVLTYQCNYNCSFCYQNKKRGQIMSLSDFEKNITTIAGEYTPTYITLMGGEISLIYNFVEYIKILRQVWNNIPISVTTNGSGSEDFYEQLFLTGVDNITFSLSTLNEEEYKKIINMPVSCQAYQKKILTVSKLGQVRINAYIYPNNVEEIYKFCKSNKLKLTFCEELREENNAVFSQLKKITQLSVIRHNKFEIIYRDGDDYEFWNYLHQDHYDYNNVIMLPDGSFTDDFGDVVKQKGDLK